MVVAPNGKLLIGGFSGPEADMLGYAIRKKKSAVLRAQKERFVTQAAERAGISYRHAWNLVEQWEAFFGAPLLLERLMGTKPGSRNLGSPVCVRNSVVELTNGSTASRPAATE